MQVGEQTKHAAAKHHRDDECHTGCLVRVTPLRGASTGATATSTAASNAALVPQIRCGSCASACAHRREIDLDGAHVPRHGTEAVELTTNGRKPLTRVREALLSLQMRDDADVVCMLTRPGKLAGAVQEPRALAVEPI